MNFYVTFVYLPGLVVRLNFKVNSPVYNTLGFLWQVYVFKQAQVFMFSKQTLVTCNGWLYSVYLKLVPKIIHEQSIHRLQIVILISAILIG